MQSFTQNILPKIKTFLYKEPVLAIAASAALLSMLFVRPDAQYIAYIDFPVLGILFCLMVVVAGLMELGVFDFISTRLIVKSRNVKLLSILLVNCVFFASMFVTNDVALIAFVPVTLQIFNLVRGEKLIFIIVMETVAANLGSMLTPVGNPQNLYLYSFYNLSLPEFLKIVLPIGAIGYGLIMLCMFFSRKGSIDIVLTHQAELSGKKVPLLFYAVMFVVCILTVLHVVDYRACVSVVLLGVLFVNKKLLARVDYGLLFTFVAFFVFVGNIERMSAVNLAISHFITGREFLLTLFSCQIISNVPAAMMVSHFTADVQSILLGVDIGGLGTPVASLASLISFKLYARSQDAKPGKYLKLFSIYNAAFLIILVAIVVTFIQ